MKQSLFALLCVALCACSDPVQRNVDRVLAGGEGVEDARMELLFAKSESLETIMEALADGSQPEAGRAALVDILWKLHLRESDPRIQPALTVLVSDPAPQVRSAVAQALTNMKDVDVLGDLLQQLAVETDDEVRHQQLKAIEALDGWTIRDGQGFEGGGVFTIAGGDNLTTEQLDLLLEIACEAEVDAAKDSLRELATEFLAKRAGQLAAEGDRLVLAADVAGAEERYRAALDLYPPSEIARQRLGQLYLFNGERQRGLDSLFSAGIAARVPRLPMAPTLDGVLNDSEWSSATLFDDFHQSIDQARVVPATGPTQAWVGYTTNSLWVGLKGYEQDTSDLTATRTDRDSGVWTDDCVEIFFDVGLTRTSFFQLVVNSIGTMGDYHYRPGEFNAQQWNGEQRVVTRVEPTYWAMEMEIPLHTIGAKPIAPGDLWGFNIARVRIAHGGEYDQWTPTYGLSLRPDRFGVILFD